MSKSKKSGKREKRQSKNFQNNSVKNDNDNARESPLCSVKALVIGDPHYTKNNVMECDRFTEEILKVAKTVSPDIIVLLGDQLDEHEKVDVFAHNSLEKLIEGLSNITVTYILMGNHDFVNNKQFLTTNHIYGPYKKWPNVRIVDYPIIENINGKLFTFCPYVEKGRFIEALNKTSDYDELWEMSDCIFAHQEIGGCQMGNGKVSTNGDIWDEGYPFLVCGHIHKSQYVFENVFYPGSSRQVNFGELDEKGVYLITFYDDSSSTDVRNVEKLEIASRSNIVLVMNVDDAKNFDYELLNHNNVKIKIEDTKERVKIFKKGKICSELEKKGVKIAYPVLNVVFIEEDVTKEENNLKKDEKTIIDIMRELIITKSDAVQDEFRIIMGDVITEEVESENLEFESD